MANFKSAKPTYKCSRCHDISVILEFNGVDEPLCPLCKGLLKIEEEATKLTQNITGIVAC